MIARNLAKTLLESAKHFPVVTVTGPRQSGKTTLCVATFAEKPRVTMDLVDVKSQAQADPRGFIAQFPGGAILDEVQHVPALLPYLREEVDRGSGSCPWILTGSQHFGLMESLTESLAGRSAVLELLPLTLDEIRRFGAPPCDLLTTVFKGGYPRIHDARIPADQWLGNYLTTYVQRDVRQVLKIASLDSFVAFVGLCAGRTAQELNLSALGADAGISHNTAGSWLTVLKASFLFTALPAWHRNIRKQMVRAPKLHAIDSGLACRLLGIGEPDQLRNHPLRGAIVESWVASEILKARTNAGRAPALFHYRDAKRLEVDIVVEGARSILLVEVKSGSTPSGTFVEPLGRLAAALREKGETREVIQRLVYGGDERRRWGEVDVIPWHEVPAIDWLV